MKEVIEYIVKSLVEDENAVSVEVEENESGETIVHVCVAQSDMGRIIGKGGKVASSIRTIAKSISGRDKRKVFVKFGD